MDVGNSLELEVYFEEHPDIDDVVWYIREMDVDRYWHKVSVYLPSEVSEGPQKRLKRQCLKELKSNVFMERV